jgi:hypothetical protein
VRTVASQAVARKAQKMVNNIVASFYLPPLLVKEGPGVVKRNNARADRFSHAE